MFVIKNATLGDLKSGELLPGPHIVVEGESSMAVSDRPVASSSAQYPDLDGECVKVTLR